MKIHSTIKEIRQRKKLSQADMAEKMNLSLVSYSSIERGITELSVSRLYELAQIFEVSVTELLGEPIHINDNEKVIALEKRVLELEKWLDDKENRIISVNKNIKALQEVILEFLLEEIALDVFENRLSKQVILNKKTKRKIEITFDNITTSPFFSVYDEKKKKYWVEKIGEFEHDDISVKAIIPKENYEKAIYKYFHNQLGTGSKEIELYKILTDYGVIDDDIIKSAITKYWDLETNGYEEGEDNNEFLDRVKI